MKIHNAMRATALAGCAFGLGLIGSSCMEERRVPNPNHCANNDGDQWCADLYPDGSRPFCILGNGVCGSTEGQDGCVAERPEDSCYSPCGDRATLDENGDCVMEESSSGSTTEGMTGETGSTTEDPTTTGPMPCSGNEDCTDAAAPFCEPMSGECVGCDGLADRDAACAEADANAPLCIRGACVACTAEDTSVCDAQALVCDEETNTCVPCTEHDQCGDAACNLFEGTCLPADAVVRVGPGQEFATLTEAVMGIPAGGQGTIIVHGNGSFDEALSVDGSRIVAFLANDGDLPRWVLTGGGSPQLTLGDATVLTDGIQVSGNADDLGILVDGGRSWLDRSRIVQNSGGGILAQNAGELVLRNCFVGGDISNRDALTVSGAEATVSYTTVLAGDGGLGESRALVCDGAATISVRNSIMVAIDDVPEVSCSGGDISFSATENAVAGMGNEALGNIQAGWFVNETSDFHLGAMAPIAIANTAEWRAGDPLTDIDGEPRPGLDGAPDAAGADVP